MKRLLAVLAGAFLILGLAAAPAGAAEPPQVKSVSLSYSGTVTSTWYCDGPLYTGVTVGFVGEAVGAPLGRGSLEIAFGAGTGGGPGAWTFTDRSGTNTLTGVAALYVENSPEGPLVGNNLSVTSGTGKFADVTGGQLLSSLQPGRQGPCVPETTVEALQGTLTGSLIYS